MKKFIVLAALAALAFSPAFEAEAASKKKTSSRSDLHQRTAKEILMQKPLKLCRKAYRTHLHFVRVNYKKRQYVCYHY